MKKTKTFDFFQENLEKFSEQEREIAILMEEFKTLMENYSSLFLNKSAYEYILKKTHLLEAGKITELFPLTKVETSNLAIPLASKNCPEIFHFLPTTNFDLGLTSSPENIDIREYCLLTNLKGEISLLSYFENGKTLIYNEINESDVFLIDFPLIIKGILEDKESPENKKLLEKIVKTNPTSTLANIYNYLETHAGVMGNFKEKILELGTFIDKVSVYVNKRAWLLGPNHKIKNNFIFVSGQRGIPYQISTAGEAKPYITLNFKSPRIYFYKFVHCAEYFPVKIIAKNNVFEPLFLAHSAFKLKTSEEKNLRDDNILFTEKDFLTLEEKVEEIAVEEEKTKLFPEWDQLQRNLNMGLEISPLPEDWFETLNKKGWKIYKKRLALALQKNFEEVLASIKDEINAIFEEKALEKQAKDNQKMKNFCKSLTEKYEAIAEILAKMYEKEIFLKVL